MAMDGLLAGARWRKSSFSGGGGAGGGNCVEAAHLPDGTVAVRDTKNPSGATVFFPRAGMGSWIEGIKAGPPTCRA